MISMYKFLFVHCTFLSQYKYIWQKITLWNVFYNTYFGRGQLFMVEQQRLLWHPSFFE